MVDKKKPALFLNFRMFASLFLTGCLISAALCYIWFQYDFVTTRHRYREFCKQLLQRQDKVVNDRLLSPLTAMLALSGIPGLDQVVKGRDAELLAQVAEKIEKHMKPDVGNSSLWMVQPGVGPVPILIQPQHRRLDPGPMLHEGPFQRLRGSRKPYFAIWENTAEVGVIRYAKPIIRDGKRIGFLLMALDAAPILSAVSQVTLPHGHFPEGSIVRKVLTGKRQNVTQPEFGRIKEIPPFDRHIFLMEQLQGDPVTLLPDVHDIRWQIMAAMSPEYIARLRREKIEQFRNEFFSLVLLCLLVSGYVTYFTHKQRKLEAERTAARGMLQRVIDSLPQAIFWENRQGGVEGSNQRFKDIMREAGVNGRDGTRLVDVGGDLPGALGWYGDETDADPRRLTETERVVGKGDDESIIAVTRAPITVSDGAGVLYACDDVTERRRLERERQRRMESIAEELHIAGRVLRSMLPRDLSGFSGLEARAAYRPSSAIGGDFYDVFALPDGRTAAYLFDVVGHGVPAALNTALARFAFSRRIKEFAEPERVLEEVNRDLAGNLGADRFLTAAALLFDPAAGVLRYANGGGPSIFKWSREGEVERISRSGMLVGLMSGVDYEGHEIPIAPGDRFLLFTDGFSEARDSRGQLFGEERIADLLAREGMRPLPDLIDTLLDRMDRFRGEQALPDDLTLLSIAITHEEREG